jgi:hypothetical protein
MKILFATCLSILIFSCSTENVENSVLDKYECINKTADASFTKSDIKAKIYGRWKLEQLITMLPNPKVPNIEIEFKDILGAPIDKQVADLYVDGKLVGTSTYSLVEKDLGNIKFVSIESEANLFEPQSKFFSTATVRICENAMIIDYGMAADAPAYILVKK